MKQQKKIKLSAIEVEFKKTIQLLPLDRSCMAFVVRTRFGIVVLYI